MSRTRPACGPGDAARRLPRPMEYPEGAKSSRRDAVAPANKRREAPGLGRPRAGSIEELGREDRKHSEPDIFELLPMKPAADQGALLAAARSSNWGCIAHAK
jgi:hypothetical protein